MIYTELTKKAMKIAIDAHAGQVDKSNMPYILHPIIVADHMKDEYTTCVALLHDVLEDTDYPEEKLKELLPPPCYQALLLVTKKPGQSYSDYIVALSDNTIARRVKIGDLEHNSNLNRLDKITDADIRRSQKYEKTLKCLREIERANENTR